MVYEGLLGAGRFFFRAVGPADLLASLAQGGWFFESFGNVPDRRGKKTKSFYSHKINNI